MFMIKLIRLCFLTAVLMTASQATAQVKYDSSRSVQKSKEVLENASVKSAQQEIQLTIRNVDISHFPEIKIIVEANNILGEPLDTLYADNLTVLENGVEKRVISVKKIGVRERVPVDFVFVIDKTATMQRHFDAVRRNISGFTQSLVRRGIDYQIGLVLYSDYVERNYGLTDNVMMFQKWLKSVKVAAGGDTKENALEALQAAAGVKFRPSANKVVVIITDAGYHQYGETGGDGVSDQTTQSIIKMYRDKEMRLFSIAPPRLAEYQMMSKSTRGTNYDIDYPFSTVLNNFSDQLTNVYALKYRSDEAAIPDSINIALLNEKKQELFRKTIPIVELGRKLIIENLLYKTNSSELPDSVPELEVMHLFLKNRKSVTIMVEGHTDGVGSHRINDFLSKRRADGVKNYLIKNGISSKRIKTKGFGERKPIATNRTAFGRKLNRRTEIVIISK